MPRVRSVVTPEAAEGEGGVMKNPRQQDYPNGGIRYLGSHGITTKEKLRHMAGKTRGDGAVSALCYRRPRSIDLTRVSWTIDPGNVTCERCIQLLDPKPK